MKLEITRKTDLAVRALVTLRDHGPKMKALALADAVGTTTGYLSQVMAPLVGNTWVRSEPGPSGGYVLTGDVAAITVLDIIEAVEGKIDYARCVLIDRPCGEQGECALHTPWTRARAELVRELKKEKLVDVVLPGLLA
jgi:Rrf2 family protein